MGSFIPDENIEKISARYKSKTKVSETESESYVNKLQENRTQNAIIRRPIKMNQSQASLKRELLLHLSAVNVFVSEFNYFY